MKSCPKCQFDKLVSEFYKAKERKDGLRATCKSCCNEAHNKWYHERGKGRKATKQAIRKSNLKKRYGITPEEYEGMKQLQGDKCAICNTPDTGKGKENWQVDHCHETDKVRGLLCMSCNIGLGSFKDNELLLAKAIEYLNGEMKC